MKVWHEFREHYWGTDELLVIGDWLEIKRIEKSMRRAWHNDKSLVKPSHCDKPKFTRGEMYGILISRCQDGSHAEYYIASASTCLKFFDANKENWWRLRRNKLWFDSIEEFWVRD